MADGDPMHIYPTPDGSTSTTPPPSGPCPAPEGDPAAEGAGSSILTSPAVAGGTDQPSI
jgi:hypothetical protein